MYEPIVTYHEPQMKYWRNMKIESWTLSFVCMGRSRVLFCFVGWVEALRNPPSRSGGFRRASTHPTRSLPAQQIRHQIANFLVCQCIHESVRHDRAFRGRDV